MPDMSHGEEHSGAEVRDACFINQRFINQRFIDQRLINPLCRPNFFGQPQLAVRVRTNRHNQMCSTVCDVMIATENKLRTLTQPQGFRQDSVVKLRALQSAFVIHIIIGQSGDDSSACWLPASGFNQKRESCRKACSQRLSLKSITL